MIQPVVSCIQTFNWLSNPFDKRFDNRLYRVYSQLSNRLYNRLNEQWLFVQPVVQPAVSCKRGIRLPVYLPASERHCHWPVLFILTGEQTCSGSLHDRGMERKERKGRVFI